MAESTNMPSPSDVGSSISASSSLYYRRRYDASKMTRREVLERRFGKSPRNSNSNSPNNPSSTDDQEQNENSTMSKSGESSCETGRSGPFGPQIPDCSLSIDDPRHVTKPRLAPKVPTTSTTTRELYQSHSPKSMGISEKYSTQPIAENEMLGRSLTRRRHQTVPGVDIRDLQQKLWKVENGDDQQSLQDEPSIKPQHLQQDDSEPEREVRYYRIVYRGVVALLSEPRTSSRRSGAYLSYGEIIASTKEIDVDDQGNTSESIVGQSTPILPQSPGRHQLSSAARSPVLSQVWQHNDESPSPPRSVMSHTAASVSSLDTFRTTSTIPNTNLLPQNRATVSSGFKKAIHVDAVLTGGYAIDAADRGSRSDPIDHTPKRGNTHPNVPMVGPSPLPIADSLSVAPSLSSVHTVEESGGAIERSAMFQSHGFLFTTRQQVQIAEPIDVVPTCESGSFVYKVVSSTPLPILTGPCIDAPKTKAMLLPGTVHEICLRMSSTTDEADLDNSVRFLRLKRRRGWVADRRVSSRRPGKSTIALAMKEVTDMVPGSPSVAEDCNVSVLSAATSSVATPVSVARRRHRPPRRRREMKDGVDLTPLPRHVGGPLPYTPLLRYETPTHCDSPLVHHGPERGVMSPSSNVSLLSDEASLELSHHIPKSAGPATPDRSVARSAASSMLSHPSFFLMRVNAPRGLKILDAPHFQVNNLIRGSGPNGSSQMSGKDLGGQSGNQSIFQTMGGHHSTTLTSKIGNPAVFDSITKARKLPRGSVFEASKRMESSGAFSKGAGLIKLSDNSGWAIVPRQEELDDQYRHYHGALSGIKEGEATRAYEEVGNAIIDDHHPPTYLRVLARGGVAVSLPPLSSTLSDDDTSPTSSAAGSSAVSGSGGSGFGQLVSQESDVTSSVGSSFLDSMFRTPTKKDAEVESRKESTSRPQARPSVADKPQVSNIIPCGTVIEAEGWVDDVDPTEQHLLRQDFVRLRGGQGWVPRQLNGKAMLESLQPPEFRFGSFWFRVQAQTGLKVRLGPSRRAPSIKSDDGVYFRFECGEFLRASEIMTIFRRGSPSECFAKLYRNRHVRLHAGHGEIRQLVSLTSQSEWVQVFSNDEVYMEECTMEPRIERHRQGWRYNVVLDARINVRKGPSFAAETNGVVLLGGESVLINERVTAPGENLTWLRLKDGQGWVHNFGRSGEALMIAHALKHRIPTHPGRPSKGDQDAHGDIAYNTIIARLFHSDLPSAATSTGGKGISSIRR